MSDVQLKDKVVLVTGAGLGLGGTIAQAMARQGASLVICDIDMVALHATQAAVEALGAQCLALACDVSDSAAVDQMFDQAGQRFGTVDVLVNNAARVPNTPAEAERRNRHYAYMTTPMPRQALGIVASLSDEDWLKWWGMVPQKSGRIINIASIAGLGANSLHSPGYSATKAGVINLTKTTALDVAGANVYVNAVACGGVLTPDFEVYLESTTEAQVNRLYQMVPSGRLGRPEEYANVAVFLAAQDHYLVGQVISPNGGFVI